MPANEQFLYPPYLIDESSEWFHIDYWSGGGWPEQWYVDSIRVYFDGDTIMERYTRTDTDKVTPYATTWNYQRKVTHRQSYNQETGEMDWQQFSYSYIRQDSSNANVYTTYANEVSASNITGDEEILLYDFSIRKHNDTIPYNIWCSTYNPLYRAKTPDFITLGGYKLRTYDVHRHDGLYKGTLIEGIGLITPNSCTWCSNFLRFKNKDFEYEP
ncbi:hypothetical protein JYT72_01605 [Crocinitomix catalasitica]|nr:hypothetical protein [Crocinitomix catalasitica]